MVREEIWPVISTLENIEDLIFMQDGAPPHFAVVVREWLNADFPGRWMARRGPHDWPVRIPDLTPSDVFLWVLVEGVSLLYQTNDSGRTLRANTSSYVFHPTRVSCKSVDAAPSQQSSDGLRNWWRILAPISNFM